MSNLSVEKEKKAHSLRYQIEETYIIKALISGVSCAIVSVILNPFDVVKIRMQNHSDAYPWPERNLFKGALHIYKEEGIRGLGRGIEASVLRELLYSSIRIGAYEPIRHMLHADDPKTASPFVKYLSSLLSGGVGAVLANPTDLVKVTFQANMPGIELPFRSTLGAFSNIYQNGGIRGLYKGTLATATRAALLTSAQLGSYDSIKNNLLMGYFGMKDGFLLHLSASMLASVITCTAANPADVVKTRYMSDHIGKYKGPLHCAITTLREGGVSIFFKGWTPSYCRLGPHTIMSFLLIEQIRVFLGFSTI